MSKPPVGRVLERKSGRKLKATTIYLPVADYQRLKRYTEREGRQVSALLVKLLRDHLDREGA